MKKILLSVFVLLSALLLVACDNEALIPKTFYELNSDQLPSYIEEYTIATTVEDITYQYAKVSNKESYHTSLEKTGLLTNFDPINKITHIKVIFEKEENSSTLLLYYGNHILPIYNERRVTSNMTIKLNEESTHFLLQSPNGGINIKKVVIYYNETAATSLRKDPLPSIYIDREKDAYGNPLPILNKEDYVNSTFRLVDEANPENNLGLDEPLENGIRLRGNSTRTKPKRPYKIKLDKKASLFGLEANKAWALLADYMDGSRLHNFAAFELAKSYGNLGFHATGTHVNLYLDDVYQGVYFLTEHQEVDTGRVPIKFKFTESTPFEEFNFMVELDRSAKFYPQEEIEGIDYFVLPDRTGEREEGFYISIKYPKLKDFEKANQADRFPAFFNYVKNYMDNMFNLFNSNNSELLEQKIDYGSLIDFLLLDTIMLETDHQSQSFKMHYKHEEDKLFFGPIWDYDLTVMGLKSDTTNSPFEFPLENRWTTNGVTNTSQYNPFFKKFVANHNGRDYLKARYNEVGSQSVEDLLQYLESYYLPYILEDLIEDFALWHNRDIAMLYENIKYMYDFLEKRMIFLDKHFA